MGNTTTNRNYHEKMFKLAIFTRADGITINPFMCSYIRSYIRNGIVVMTEEFIQLLGGFQTMNEIGANGMNTIVIIGNNEENADKITSACLFVKDIKDAIKLLSQKYHDKIWWLIGDNRACNQFIENGLVMHIHHSQSFDDDYSNEWVKLNSNLLTQNTLFNTNLIEKNDFEILSNVKCVNNHSKRLRHYVRKNEEEITLLNAMNNIIQNGFVRPTRTGVKSRSLFGQMFEYTMVEKNNPETGISSYRLPLLTTKRMFTRGVFTELKWFLSGGTDSKTLEDQGINIWKGNTTKEFLNSVQLGNYNEGETGPIYGFQWRHWNAKYIQGKKDYNGEGVDQVGNVIRSLINDPYGRRHIISGWNVEQLSEMCLPPCHVLYQFLVHEENGQKYLSLMMYQRSCDVFLGLPFNICSLGMFLMIMAHRVDMKPYKIIHNVADFHLYETHIEAATKQIQREPCCFPYISITCDKKNNLEDYDFTDIQINDYHHHNGIKAEMLA